jgi:LacI family transcriptional regulator
MATIKEVAELAGVSVGTVSNVLAGTVPVRPALRDRVLRAIQKLDYHPNQVARSLKVKQTKMIGMVIPDITNPFFPQLVRGAEDVAFSRGYLLVTLNTDDDAGREKQILSILRSRRLDGVLLVTAPNDGNVSHINDAVAAGLPIVCVDRVPPGMKLDSVSVDSVEGATVAVRHLISMGHKRIGIITGSLQLTTAADRLKGYRAAMKEANLEVAPDLIREGSFRVDSGWRLGKELLLMQNPPSAIFVSNALMMVGVLRALEETGIQCPEGVALACFDDLPVADVFRPHITTVSQPAYEIGRRSADLLLDRIEGKEVSKTPRRIRLMPELKIKESSAPHLSNGFRQFRAAAV